MCPLLNLLLTCSLLAVTFALSKTHEQRSLQQFEVIRLGLEPKTPTLKVLCSTS